MSRRLLCNVAYIFFFALLAFAVQWGVLPPVVSTAQAQLGGYEDAFKIGVENLAICTATSLTTQKEARGSAEACQCLKRLHEVKKALDALLDAHEKWDKDIKNHECTRTYLGEEFKKEYGRYDDSSHPRPQKGEIEKAEEKTNGKIALAKTECGKVNDSELKDIKEIQDLRKKIKDKTGKINKKGSLVCRQMTVRVACIDEAIEFYKKRYKKDQQQVDGNLLLDLGDKRKIEQTNKIKVCSPPGD